MGKNKNGQLGLNDRIDRYYPTIVKSLDYRIINEINGGFDFSACVTFDGSLITWGNNQFGQLGYRTNVQNQLTPKTVEIKDKPFGIACGYQHQLVRTESGLILACGSNPNGCLGVGADHVKVDELLPVVTTEEFDQIFASNFSAGLTPSGSLYLWGETPYGFYSRPMKLVEFENNVRKVGLGEDFQILIDMNNAYYSWGKNDFGQLGIGDTVNKENACQIEGLQDRETKTINCGKNFIVILMNLAQEILNSFNSSKLLERKYLSDHSMNNYEEYQEEEIEPIKKFPQLPSSEIVQEKPSHQDERSQDTIDPSYIIEKQEQLQAQFEQTRRDYINLLDNQTKKQPSIQEKIGMRNQTGIVALENRVENYLNQLDFSIGVNNIEKYFLDKYSFSSKSNFFWFKNS